MISVVLVDDEQALRRGIRLILEGADDIEVAGDIGNGKDGVGMATRLRPDVVLMDIRMPVMDGIQATQLLQSALPSTPIVMLTAFDTDTFILDALHAGAMDFLLKTTTSEALVASVRAVAAGQKLLSPQALAHLLAMNTRKSQEVCGIDGLSSRENGIAQLVAQGLNNQEIAEQLYVSVATVKTHIGHILDKIGGTNRVHIAIAMLERT
ncbi:Transcriptional regulatory protein LiaR [Corynebacterium ciconiae DSM 44920]|uniref:response regulator n=1 Tax=Corynebacterium ciconiae TaxID=227319 RepID=UPI0003786D42|nr:response regulator transcription factor [Corynebacterium ciconiae]WKD60095.1 Transcriptional regulatory protein LiaR [Corynebacterium ciconiae DSM 44920]